VTEEQVFLAALDLPDAAARAAYLDRACGPDARFRRQVEVLLAAHYRSGEFLDVPAADQLSGHSTGEATVTHPGDAAMNPDADPDDLGFLTPSDRPDSLGRIGHYEVLQVLGRGAFGIVFRALDDVLRRVVAVKVLSPQMAATSPARRRFIREARSSAAVRHENVVQVHEVQEQPLPFLVMEFIPGETLQRRIDRIGPLDVPEVLRVGRQVASGLAAAHATGLIHRDVKPVNLLIENDAHQRVKITDFGLARAADDASITQSGVVAGTPLYMSPEQARGEALDHRADLFSLGSVMYTMAVGRPAFRAGTSFAVLKRVVEEDPRPIRDVNPEVPPWLCDVIAKLHAKNPADRFQTAQEVADLLAACEATLDSNSGVNRIPALAAVAGLSAPAESSSNRRSGRRRKWAVAAAVLLLPVIALAATELAGATHLFTTQATAGTTSPAADPPPTAAKNEPPVPVVVAPPTVVAAKPGPPPPAVAPFDAPRARKHQEDWASHLDVPFEYGPTAAGHRFRLIPPGTFLMGADPGDDLASRNERPQHEVTLTRPFYLAIHEITFDQFRQFTLEDKYTTWAEFGDRGAWCMLGGKPLFGLKPGLNWRTRPAKTLSDDHPVTCIAWDDGVRYCAWLSKKEGKTYRLPTEAEWEYACRAGTTTRFSFGKELDKLKANLGHEYQTPVRVGFFPPNPFGLHEMHGNVGEWCLDPARSYAVVPATDPVGNGKDGTTKDYVYRGGQWFSQTDSGKGRSSYRQFAAPDVGVMYAGFRIVLELPPRSGRT
jgi:formylglycine-generating enzyme required for sulfatase activity/serine/threonine protein kinase